MIIAKGELEENELRAYLLEALDFDEPQTTQQVHRQVRQRLRKELGRFAPVWRCIEVFGVLNRMRMRRMVRKVPGGWLRGCL